MLNYVEAAEHAIAWIQKDRPLSAQVLYTAHDLLLSGTASDRGHTGKLRDSIVVIGPEGTPVVDARFVPPPPGDRLQAGFDEWLRWVNAPHELPLPVVLAMAHYQFEALHPFHDGNGRIGRLVVLLQLMAAGELSEALFEVSSWFERRRREYQDRLFGVSAYGEWDEWVRFFCEGLLDQALTTTRRINEMLAFRERVTEEVREANLRGTAVDVAAGLIGQPYLSPTATAEMYDVSYPTANNAITRLADLGVVREMTGSNYGRIYVADEVLAILGR